MSDDIQNAIESALRNVLVAASIGVNWYNTRAPSGTVVPFGVFEYVGSDADDTGSTKTDVFRYVIKVIDDVQQRSAQTSASYMGKTRTALSGAAIMNTTGSLSGYTCTDLRRLERIRYIDGSNYWHVGDRFTIRVTT